MMDINLQTYEALLLDYLEGRLDQYEVAALMAFVESHPELGSWEKLTEELPTMSSDVLSYPDKNALLFESMPSTLNGQADELMFKAVEGIASAGETERLEAWLHEQPQRQSEFKIWQLTRLKPDPKIVFPNKQTLLRKAETIVPFWVRSVAVAASFALLLSWGWWLYDKKPVSPTVDKPIAMKLPEEKFPETEQTHPHPQSASHNKVDSAPSTSNHSFSHSNIQSETLERNQQPPLPSLSAGNGLARLDMKHLYRSEFMFYEPDVSQQLALAFVLQQMNDPEPKPHPGALQRIANNLWGRASALVQPRQTGNKLSFKLWDIAQRGVSTYNYLVDKDIELRKTENVDGTGSIRFKSEKIDFERRIAEK